VNEIYPAPLRPRPFTGRNDAALAYLGQSRTNSDRSYVRALAVRSVRAARDCDSRTNETVNWIADA